MKIYITENKYDKLSEAIEKPSFFTFFDEMKSFIYTLLTHPSDAKLSFKMKANGLNKQSLIKLMIKRGIIEQDSTIGETENEIGNTQAVLKTVYRVPKKNFVRKMKRLYAQLFDKDSYLNDEQDVIISEDEGGSENGFGGATSANVSADSMYDVPFGQVQRKKIYKNNI